MSANCGNSNGFPVPPRPLGLLLHRSYFNHSTDALKFCYYSTKSNHKMLRDTLLDYEARFWSFVTQPQVFVAFAVAVPAALAFQYYLISKQPEPRSPPQTQTYQQYPSNQTIMSRPDPNLPLPKADPFTLEELGRYDGTDRSLPIYVSIKGEWNVVQC